MEETSVTIRADTLFSALCLTMRELGEDISSLCQTFPHERTGTNDSSFLPPKEKTIPPFIITSTFPFAGDIFLLPRPMLPLVGAPYEADPSIGKSLKKVRFVSKTIFEAILAGQSVRPFILDSNEDSVRKDVFLQNGSVWVTPSELVQLAPWLDPRTGSPRLWAKTVAPHVAVDRVSSQSQVYGVGRVYFAAGSGLFFLAQYNDKGIRPRIEQALRVLGDTGIGGERSTGHGQFCVEIIESFQLQEPTPQASTNSGYCTLSLYWPTSDEVRMGVLTDASYMLIQRRGWLASPDGMNLRRRTVRTLSEGSVTPVRPVGALVDVKPLDPAPVSNVPHDVWRYGMAFPLRCVRRVIDGKE